MITLGSLKVELLQHVQINMEHINVTFELRALVKNASHPQTCREIGTIITNK